MNARLCSACRAAERGLGLQGSRAATPKDPSPRGGAFSPDTGALCCSSETLAFIPNAPVPQTGCVASSTLDMCRLERPLLSPASAAGSITFQKATAEGPFQGTRIILSSLSPCPRLALQLRDGRSGAFNLQDALHRAHGLLVCVTATRQPREGTKTRGNRSICGP